MQTRVVLSSRMRLRSVDDCSRERLLLTTTAARVPFQTLPPDLVPETLSATLQNQCCKATKYPSGEFARVDYDGQGKCSGSLHGDR